MVSLQATIENPASKKRKWEDGEEGESVANVSFSKERKLWRNDRTEAASDVELHLDTPLPLEWQRCLDIKSGQIHFYNTRTHKRTSMDPRKNSEPPSSRPSLDLELNLKCQPVRGHADGEERTKEESGGGDGERCNPRDNSGGVSRSTSWVSVDGDQKEMVAAVCIRCHMLVMMCKAAPSCPNCKYVHPPDQSSSMLVKPGFRLLCCRD